MIGNLPNGDAPVPPTQQSTELAKPARTVPAWLPWPVWKAEKACSASTCEPSTAAPAVPPNAVPIAVSKDWPTDQVRPTLAQLATALGEPLLVTRRLLKSNRAFLRSVETMRHQVQARSRLDHYFESFHCGQAAAYQSLCQADPRSRILVGFHVGDFLFGFYRLLAEQASQPGQNLLLLTERIPSPAMRQNFRTLFPKSNFMDRCQISLNEVKVAQLRAFLRQPKATLITFFDLPPVYGRCCEQRLFNRPVHMQLGPAILARIAGVPLLPVSCSRDSKGFKVSLGQQIEPGDPQETTGRLTGTLQKLLEKKPEQWRFLQRLPEFARQRS